MGHALVLGRENNIQATIFYAAPYTLIDNQVWEPGVGIINDIALLKALLADSWTLVSMTKMGYIFWAIYVNLISCNIWEEVAFHIILAAQ